jgi:cell division transport system permease protein
MTGLLAQLRYFARSAWLGLRSSPLPSVVSVATIAVSLFLIGVFVLLLTNMSGILERFGREVRLTAYVDDSLVRPEAERALLERVRRTPGVARAEWVSREQALERFRERLGGESALLDGIDENPLPASVEIELAPAQRSAEGLARAAQAVAALDGVAEVSRGHAWVEGYARAVSLVRAGSAVLGAVLGLAALVIVSNTIRLAVYARRDEIEILMLVGAARSFAAVPFLLEGLILGTLGGLLALGLLWLAYALLGGPLEGGLTFLLGHASPRFLDGSTSLWLVAAGAGLGVVGSAAAVAQGLRA